MKLHGNARTCLHIRLLMVRRLEEEGWTLAPGSPGGYFSDPRRTSERAQGTSPSTRAGRPVQNTLLLWSVGAVKASSRSSTICGSLR